MGSNARVLVTGATGKIGKVVVNELLARGYQVRALTSRPITGATGHDRIEWRQLDFQQSLDFDPIVQDCAAVIHLAAEMPVIERMKRSNVVATRALAEASERARIKFFCYTSSVSVYGSSRRSRVAESSPVLTTSRDVRSEYWGDRKLRSYGRTKLEGEQAISAVAQNVEYVIVRPTVVVGVQDLMELENWGMAKKGWSASRHAHHIYVHDVADAILWFLERCLQRDQPVPGVRTFNLSEDDTPISTFGQIFKAAYEVSGDRRWRVVAIPWPIEWLVAILKSRRLLLRHPFGRMIFAGDALRAEGYHVTFGMSEAVHEFCAELARRNESSKNVNKRSLVS